MSMIPVGVEPIGDCQNCCNGQRGPHRKSPTEENFLAPHKRITGRSGSVRKEYPQNHSYQMISPYRGFCRALIATVDASARAGGPQGARRLDRRLTASAGKSDFSYRTGKTHFHQSMFLRPRKNSVRETPGGAGARARARISTPYPLSNRFSRSRAVFNEW
jgi:hypothetical protein